MTLALIYDGASRRHATEAGGVTLLVVRDWVRRFNAYGPEGLIDRKPPGHPSRLMSTGSRSDGGPRTAVFLLSHPGIEFALD